MTRGRYDSKCQLCFVVRQQNEANQSLAGTGHKNDRQTKEVEGVGISDYRIFKEEKMALEM